MALASGLTVCCVVAMGLVPAYAADLKMEAIDKICWVEIFEDDIYDDGDPQVKLQGPKEGATLKQSSEQGLESRYRKRHRLLQCSVHVYKGKDHNGTGITFVPDQRVPNLGRLDMANDIESIKVTYGRGYSFFRSDRPEASSQSV